METSGKKGTTNQDPVLETGLLLAGGILHELRGEPNRSSPPKL
jgi:hypothetical protein